MSLTKKKSRNIAPPVASAGISQGALKNTPNISMSAFPNGYLEYHLPFSILMCGEGENPYSGIGLPFGSCTGIPSVVWIGVGMDILLCVNNFA